MTHGFPFSFVFGNAIGPEIKPSPYHSRIDPEDAKSIIYNPYRITICDGGRQTQKKEMAHYPVSRDSDLFANIFTRCGAFFEDAMVVPPEPEIPIGKWGELVSERSILIEYKTPIRQDIVKWIIDRSNTVTGAPTEIRKILVIPEDVGGKQSVYLYTLTNDKIIKVLSPSTNYFEMQKLLNDGMALLGGGLDAPGGGETKYSTISEVGGGRFPNFAQDVFCIVEGPKTGEFRRIGYTAPARVRDKSELENIILSSDIYSYNRSIDYNDTLVFKNITSFYHLYKDGFMEYNYFPVTQPGEKGSLVAALENSLMFILNVERQLLGSADLILSGIYDEADLLSYRFTFDYIKDDYPIYFKYEHNQGDSPTTYRNAITIKANANRTLSCRWMLVDLFLPTETKKMQVYFDKIEVGQSLTKMAVSDIAIAYMIDLNKDYDSPERDLNDISEEVVICDWPVWAITPPGGAAEMVEMSGG